MYNLIFSVTMFFSFIAVSPAIAREEVGIKVGAPEAASRSIERGVYLSHWCNAYCEYDQFIPTECALYNKNKTKILASIQGSNSCLTKRLLCKHAEDEGLDTLSRNYSCVSLERK